MPIPFLNSTDYIGQIFWAGTNNITGDVNLTLFAIILVFLAFFIAFRVDLTWSVLFMLPLLIVVSLASPFVMNIVGVIMLAVIILIGITLYRMFW